MRERGRASARPPRAVTPPRSPARNGASWAGAVRSATAAADARPPRAAPFAPATSPAPHLRASAVPSAEASPTNVAGDNEEAGPNLAEGGRTASRSASVGAPSLSARRASVDRRSSTGGFLPGSAAASRRTSMHPFAHPSRFGIILPKTPTRGRPGGKKAFNSVEPFIFDEDDLGPGTIDMTEFTRVVGEGGKRPEVRRVRMYPLIAISIAVIAALVYGIIALGSMGILALLNSGSVPAPLSVLSLELRLEGVAVFGAPLGVALRCD